MLHSVCLKWIIVFSACIVNPVFTCVQLTANSSSYGVINGHNYSNYEHQCWIIDAGSDHIVHAFKNEPLHVDKCCCDKIVLKCDSADGPVIGTYCDGDDIDDLYSSGQQMYVLFTRNLSILGCGVFIYYEAVSSDSHSSSCSDEEHSSSSDDDEHSSTLSGGVVFKHYVGITAMIVVLVVIAVVVSIVCKIKRGLGQAHGVSTVTTSTQGVVNCVSTPGVTVISSYQEGPRTFIPVAQPPPPYAYADPNKSHIVNLNQPAAVIGVPPPTYSQSVEPQYPPPKYQQNMPQVFY